MGRSPIVPLLKPHTYSPIGLRVPPACSRGSYLELTPLDGCLSRRTSQNDRARLHTLLRDIFQSIFQPSEQVPAMRPCSIENTKEHTSDTLIRQWSSLPVRLCKKTWSLSISFSVGAVLDQPAELFARGLVAGRVHVRARRGWRQGVASVKVTVKQSCKNALDRVSSIHDSCLPSVKTEAFLRAG